MKYEIYSEQEFTVGEHDDPERITVLAELGMSNEASSKASRFRALYEEECFVFGALFPHIVELSNYKGFIPTRVLQEIRDYKMAGLHKRILVLCPKPGDVDPVVVGCEYTWHSHVFSGNSHIIARFGDALEDFSTLRARAFERIKEKMDHLQGMPTASLVKIAETLFAA